MSGSSDLDDEEAPIVEGRKSTSLVVRSSVPAVQAYGEYKPHLRQDFFHSCAYCTMSEAEARAIRFTIDHYEPRKLRPDLENQYDNLMYACDTCNQLKGDRSPSQASRDDGYRFFRPDCDERSEHFEKKGFRVEAKSNAGYFSIEALDLNRYALRRLREIRKRLTNCDELVSDGIMALRKFHIDQLPPHIKGAAVRAIHKAIEASERLASEVDSVLLEYAKSDLIDPDVEKPERAKTRLKNLRDLEALYPGTWRTARR